MCEPLIRQPEAVEEFSVMLSSSLDLLIILNLWRVDSPEVSKASKLADTSGRDTKRSFVFNVSCPSFNSLVCGTAFLLLLPAATALEELGGLPPLASLRQSKAWNAWTN